jgi:hypothetical protein
MKKREEMSQNKRKRVQEMYNVARANPKVWYGISKYLIIKQFAEKWGISRATVIKDYEPHVRLMMKGENAQWQSADGQTLLTDDNI